MNRSMQQFIFMNIFPAGLPYYLVIFINNIINFIFNIHSKFNSVIALIWAKITQLTGKLPFCAIIILGQNFDISNSLSGAL